MAKPLTFQDAIFTLQKFWADRGCILWQPYNIQVGAGTMNPATFLRVLGPEPWSVAYVEPSIRPDDGRYGDNPNRMQMHYQLQVILKPDPGNPQELYLESLEVIGIDRRKHDIRFVEDKWESPALGAWGLGWEVWLDGQEITQFTYFQQAGGMELTVPSVEITYGLERIVLALQGVDSVWDINWGHDFQYRDALWQSEVEHCRYYFEVADVNALRNVFDIYEREAQNALSQQPPLVMPAHDYVLKCSHLFNVLDTRGAIGVVERAQYFKRMQSLAARVAEAYVEQRGAQEAPVPAAPMPKVEDGDFPIKPAPFLLEIGVEELPTADLDSALTQLRKLTPALLDIERLDYKSIDVVGTPRRLVVYVEKLAPRQRSEEQVIKGPPTSVAYDATGNPTSAATGFARKNSLNVDDLERRMFDGGEYAVAIVRTEGRPTWQVLQDRLRNLLLIGFERSMRWDNSDTVFSRPIRWVVALCSNAVPTINMVPLNTQQGILAGRITRGSRLNGSPEIEVKNPADYFKKIEKQGIILDPAVRRAEIERQIIELATQANGRLRQDPNLLDEVTNLVEQPTAFLGQFDKEFLDLPEAVLITVMKKHQRYFAVENKKGKLLPYFIGVRNGDDQHLDSVIRGNEHVLRARFADARFFFQQDTRQRLADFLPKLKTLAFQEQLGSYYDKSARLEGLVARIGGMHMLRLSDADLDTAIRAARLCKADLATHMVVELTSLQGIIGREYALLSGEPQAVADAIAEHYLPRQAGDALPASWPGITLALADRLDSLVGLLAVGMIPTGSADPYGLRRAAQGIVQIVMGNRIPLDLRQVIAWVAQTQPVPVSDEAQADALDFIAGRLRVLLREEHGYRHDVVEAVLGAVFHDPNRCAVHADQLSRQVARPDWPSLLDAFSRCARITRDQPEQLTLRPDAFAEPVEKRLYEAYRKANKSLVNPADQYNIADVDQFVAAFEPLVESISAFFAPAAEGGVMVMDKDKALRENRLALLQHIVALGEGVADFSQLEGF